MGGTPTTGGRHNLTETCADWGQAEVALTQMQNQVDENRHPRSAISMAAAIEPWLEVADLEETTRDRYEDLIRVHPAPARSRQAGAIDAELLERFFPPWGSTTTR